MKIKHILSSLALGLALVCNLNFANEISKVNPAVLGFTTPAEFSPQESIWLAWPQMEPRAGHSNIPQIIEIIKHTSSYEYVDLIVNNKNEEQKARKLLTAAHAELSKVRFHAIPHNDFWLRDTGAIFIHSPSGQLAAVRFKFNGWGMAAVSKSMQASVKQENKVSELMADQRGISSFDSSLVAEGGVLEFNGNGTLITTEAVILQPQRNPGITKENAEAELKRLFGVKKVIWMKQGIVADDSTFTGTKQGPSGPVLTALTTNGHTDEFVRWVNDDTVLLAEVTRAEAEQAGSNSIAAETRRRLEENYHILKNSTNQDGKSIKIIRIPAADEIYQQLQAGDSTYDGVIDMKRIDVGHEGEPILGKPAKKSATFVSATSYLNYLVTNKAVFIPEYWQPGRPESMREKDKQARAVIQAAFPDREVIAIKNMEDVNIGGGGIHCISQQMPAVKTE